MLEKHIILFAISNSIIQNYEHKIRYKIIIIIISSMCTFLFL